MIRENRLYQADWLMRYYHFTVDEIVSPENPLLDMQVDPKLSWALRNLHLFPLDINKADYKQIMRVPGIGIQSAQKICEARKFTKLNMDNLKKIGIALNRAKYFINTTDEKHLKEYQPMQIKDLILNEGNSKYKPNFSAQLKMF